VENRIELLEERLEVSVAVSELNTAKVGAQLGQDAVTPKAGRIQNWGCSR
jgi:hypothetical protein